jgi:hypothetical protein
MKVQTVRQNDLTGGVNFGSPPHEIKQNELANAVNFKPAGPEGGRIRTRGGTRRMAVIDAAGTVQILGFQSTQKGGEWAGLIWGSHGLAYVSGSPLACTPYATLVPSQVSEAWSTADWQGTMYGARESNGLVMTRLDPSPVAAAAGIAPPSFVAVAATGGAGQITTANYSYVFTYYDSISGAESSYGPVSNTLAHVGPALIGLTGLVASTNARVDSIRIYRTFPNGTGAWYLVATVPHTAVSYNDNIPVTAQGQAASATNGLPPIGAFAVANWNGRLWVTDGRFVYPSKIGNPEAFDPGDVLSVGSPTDEITGLIAMDDALVVGRRQGMSYITGSGRTSWFIGEADPVTGLVGQHAISRVSNDVYWLSDSGLYRGSGTTRAIPVSGDRLHPWFHTNFGFIPFATADETRKSALGSLPTSGGVIFTTSIAGGTFFYHIPTDSFWIWRQENAAGSAQVPLFFAKGIDAGGRDWAWSSDQPVNLVRLDDESYYFDDIQGVVENVAQRFTPAFVDLGRAKGLVEEIRVKWSGSDPKVVVPDPSTGVDFKLDDSVHGNVELRVYRDWVLSTGSQRIQEERTVPISPKEANGKHDSCDEWKVYGMKHVGANAVPSNTLGIQFDFVPATGDQMERPLWVGAVEYDVLVTDLPERRF